MGSEVGKISPQVFSRLIETRLGRPRGEVLAGPRAGVDVSIVLLEGGQVMASTCDPVFVVPAYGFRRAAWFAVHILASDAAMSGLPPRYMTIDLNLPPEITDDELGELWTSVHETCESLGIAIISGHTARYDGCHYPMVGGATVIALGDRRRYVTSAMARPGDLLVCTKGAAIEATALMAATFPTALRRRLGEEVAQRAEDLFFQMSVVTDAMAAVSVGVRDDGVTALHDATEGGILGGVFEIAEASGVGVRLDEEAVIIRPEVRAVSDLVAIDPLASISEGTLLMTVRPHRSEAVLEALKSAGIEASAIGEILPRGEGMRRVRRGASEPLRHPGADPFWGAFARAQKEGW